MGLHGRLWRECKVGVSTVFRQRELTIHSHPNKLSYNLLDNLLTLSGSPSYIRAGGSSGNLPTYDPTQTVGVIEGFANANADQPNKVTIGPAWYQSFKTFPVGTKYVYQVNYRNNSTQGVSNTIAEAKRVYAALGNTLESYELGNEVYTPLCT